MDKTAIQEEIKRQGDVVRKLKSSGAAKDEVCWYFFIIIIAA